PYILAHNSSTPTGNVALREVLKYLDRRVALINGKNHRHCSRSLLPPTGMSGPPACPCTTPMVYCLHDFVSSGEPRYARMRVSQGNRQELRHHCAPVPCFPESGH